MKENLKGLCDDYSKQLLERNHLTQGLEERIALAMYKIDEACALVDAHVELETDHETREAIQLLLERSKILQRQFRAIDHMEKIVDAMAASTKQIQERTEYVKKHAEPILNPSQISTMLKRTLTLGRKKAGTGETILWEPVTFIPNTATCMRRLDEIMTHEPDEIAAAYINSSKSESKSNDDN